ncbi:MAG: FliA/WhiG family RNA polymerase sigma factor [Actinomycetia bacterium]|nr:FliA/WhiG family RNA polymerase sigma factor [Actinomycetes bacterium]MCP4962506.1 FliA/WhiG family RNA polymerase sigma factor [Actinomycetes bacterium]
MSEYSDIDDIWRRYHEHGDPDARDRLIVHYSPLVKFVASRVAAGLPGSVEQPELVSNGVFGLIDAISKFQPERGFKFETYAMARIRGAILDELRSYDWVPRSVRAKARQIERANQRFVAKHHRVPSEDELADELGVPLETVRRMLKQVSAAGVLALEDPFSGDEGESSTLGDLLTDGTDDPEETFESDEQRFIMATEINRLPEREKLILALYYYEGMTLADIGLVLKVTESRICQIHTKAVVHLKQRLAAVERDTSGTSRGQ